jgi:hypothetical protein
MWPHQTGAGTRKNEPQRLIEYPMMLRSAASPGSVGSAGRRWRIVASSYRCQLPAGPLYLQSMKSFAERTGRVWQFGAQAIQHRRITRG